MDQQLIEKFVRALDENKCTDIKVLDVKKITYIADYFVIATVRNKPHAEMIYEKVDEIAFKETGNPYCRVEGREEGEWVLVDTGDMIVHLFQESARATYNLDGLWADAEELDISDWLID